MASASSAVLIRLRPEGAWRIGAAAGDRNRSGSLFHSDTLFSAVSHAMDALGWLEEWLAATAQSETGAAVRISSLFPSQEEHLLAPPPAHLWPTPAATRLRAAGARLIPTVLIRALALDESWNEDQWEVDPLSECLLRRGRRRAPGAPYRSAVRSHAAVDRIDPGRSHPHQTACIEFAEGAGLWCMALLSDGAASRWTPRLEACFRLLGDTGVGGERRNGWGHFVVESATSSGAPLDLLWGRHQAAAPTSPEDQERPPSGAPSVPGWWLLSAFSPAADDDIDWSRGNYRLMERGGRVESRSGSGAVKQTSRMVEEGSVLIVNNGEAPRGRAWNVAPQGFPHPVWRAGFAVAVELPWRVPS